MGRPHDIAIGTKLRIRREVTTAWGWRMSPGETVEVVAVRTQPTRFESRDSQGRVWILSTHDVDMDHEKGKKA